MAVTKWNKKVWGIVVQSPALLHPTLLSPQTSVDMGKLVDEGINSFKFFMAYKVGLF